MKLFKSLLVAPATLGLLSPIAVTANEINFNDVSNYSSSEEVLNISEFETAKELAVTNSRVDGLEARFNNFEAGSFSETTTASFSADMLLGAVTGGPVNDSTEPDTLGDGVMAGYSFQIDLNTSFTGEDSLDVSIDAGNGSTSATGTVSSGVKSNPLAEFDLNAGSDNLTVDGVSYTFPLGDSMTAIVGDNTDGSALFTTACAYGGPSNTLDDCGNVNAGITNGGAMAGASYDFDNGLTAAIGYAGAETGLMTQETNDAYGANLAYTADNYGVSLTYGVIETSATAEDTYTALNAYYSLDNGMSISAGYEVGDIGGAVDAVDENISFFLGLTWDEVGPGSAGIALGHSTREGSDEEYMYEAYYSYPMNDGMTVTPLVFVKENSTAGKDDTTGVMVKTSFSF